MFRCYSIRLLVIFILISFFSLEGKSQTASKRDIYLEYIDKYSPVAIREMKVFHIPASITLSQALIESGAGKSELAVKANNHFGIKCHEGWDGATFAQDDDAPKECFRKYKSADESFRDHSLFLTQRPRYASLFKLGVFDYKAWANGLRKAGYATNPRYADILIKVIEDYELDKYDNFKVNMSAKPYKFTKPSMAETKYQYFHPEYVQPGADDFTFVEERKAGRKVYMNNGILFVFANKDDSFLSAGGDVNIRAGKLARLNEMKRNEPLVEGQIVYLEKKKSEGIRETYTVQPHDTWYSISQFTGVQVKALKELNPETGDSIPLEGKTLHLKGHVKRSFFQRLFSKN
jgi:Mannosyl-glycoprotein endo-beta-N-acetylglucosaminidase/LysM domain